MLSNIVITDGEYQYTIYSDGVVYNNTPTPEGEPALDVPEWVFETRNAWIASLVN